MELLFMSSQKSPVRINVTFNGENLDFKSCITPKINLIPFNLASLLLKKKFKKKI